MKKMLRIVVSWDDIRDALVANGTIQKDEWPSQVTKIETTYSDGPKVGLSWDIATSEDLAK